VVEKNYSKVRPSRTNLPVWFVDTHHKSRIGSINIDNEIITDGPAVSDDIMSSASASPREPSATGAASPSAASAATTPIRQSTSSDITNLSKSSRGNHSAFCSTCR
jgi:hypothetical protein